MKSSIEKITDPKFAYPCLIKHNRTGVIVLAVGNGKGTIVNIGKSNYMVGQANIRFTFAMKDNNGWSLLPEGEFVKLSN